MPLQEILRRRNLPGQSIACCALLIAISISIVLHSLSAFPLVQISLLTVGIWIIFLRKHLFHQRLDANFINKLRMWFDLFKRLIATEWKEKYVSSTQKSSQTAPGAADAGRGERGENLRDSPMMAHLLDALQAKTDIGHYEINR